MTVSTKVSHFISWHRRVIAVALAVTGLLALLAHLNSPPPDTVAAVTVRQELVPGRAITSQDVVLARLPPEMVPADALADLDDAVGETPVAALSAGSVLSLSLLRRTQAAAPGRSLVPIVVQESALHSLLVPGTVISLTLSHSEGTDTVTDDAVVAALPEPSEDSGPLPAPHTKNIVIVDVPSEVAGTVAALGQQGGLAFILSGD